MVRGIRSSILIILGLLVMFQSNVSQVSAADHWDNALSHVNNIYDDLTVLKVDISSKKKLIQEQRAMNNDALKQVNVKINNIDLELINRLQIQYDQTLRKHSPVLEQYTALSKQATAAKQNKDKKLADILDLKRNKMLTSVLVARSDVKATKDTLASAKKQRSIKLKKIKEVLAPVQNYKKMITAENKTIATTKQSYSAAEKRYKASVKQGNAITAAEDITLMYNEMQVIQTSQQHIYVWEKQISQIILLIESQIPK
ncbi:hypothetical protein ACP8HI_07030 [Paenibacillus sp. FA6]|uniref:hypothetical protein n=1 Tax=Paenibacillus sp. FA6 TaxID=3413029 RepID=UPI003F655906